VGPTGADGDPGPAGPTGVGETGATGPSGTSVVIGGTGATQLSAAATNFVAAGAFAVNISQTVVAAPIPSGGPVTNLQVRLTGNPGAGKTYTFTVIRNGAATGLTCLVTGGTATTCTATDATVWAAGDTISLQATPTSNPTQRSVAWSVTIG
jgi:hypothetical protein